MDLKFVEATQDGKNGPNWGKFGVGRFTVAEWRERCKAPGTKNHLLLHSQGWAPEHTLVLDLATGEGAIFRLGGQAQSDLNKHKIWVCPLFEPFLVWLYGHYNYFLGDNWWEKLPRTVELADVSGSFYGMRRSGAEVLSDGFGNSWLRCKPNCDLEIVRPGKVQCVCDKEDYIA